MKMLFQVYKALVESRLRYADVVWGSLSDTKITALRRLQNRTFEIIQGSNIKDYRSDVSILRVKIRPESLHDKFAERSSISKYDTRNKTDLQIPRLNLDFSRKIFNYTGLKTWNSIPTHIRGSGTLTRFKNGLKSHFLS